MVQLIICCLYIVLFVFMIYKGAFFKLPGLSVNSVILLFILKIIAATVLWKLFIFYYPVSDAIVFFNDSKALYDSCWDDPTQFLQVFFGCDGAQATTLLQSKMQVWNSSTDTFLIDNSRMLIRINVLFRFFSFGYFYVHAILFCFFSFIGLVYLYKLFFPYLRSLYFILMIALFLIPSVLFWSSTVLKEGLVFLGLGLLLYHCQCGLRKKYTLKNIIGSLAGMGIILLIKMYVLFALLPALMANIWIACSTHKRITFKYIFTYCFCFVLLLAARFVSPGLDVATIVKNKQSNFINSAKGGILLQHDSTFVYVDYNHQSDLESIGNQVYKLKKGVRFIAFKHGISDTVYIDGSADTSNFTMLYAIAPSTSTFVIAKLQPSMIDILRKIPVAFCTTLVLPSLFSVDKVFSALILIQNIVLLLFLLCVLLFFIKRKFPLAITFFCFSFVILLFSLIGLTTPVLGALVRYRAPGIPFLIIAFSLLVDERKMVNFINYLKVNLIKKDSYPKKESS